MSPPGEKGGGDGGSPPEKEPGWLARTLAGGGSSLALAFVANKALFPLRAPVTLALTPAVARALRVRAAGVAGRAAAAEGRKAP
jgi:hypothetical protein